MDTGIVGEHPAGPLGQIWLQRKLVRDFVQGASVHIEQLERKDLLRHGHRGEVLFPFE
jgi:hypothetical protein